MDLFENNRLSSLTIAHPALSWLTRPLTPPPWPRLLLRGWRSITSSQSVYWVFTQPWPQNGNILVWAQLSPGLTCCHQMLTGDRRLPTFQTKSNHKNIPANEAGSEERRNNQISRLILLSWETIIVCIVVTCEVWRGHWEDIWCGRCYPHLLSSHWIIVVRGGGDCGGVEPMAKPKDVFKINASSPSS